MTNHETHAAPFETRRQTVATDRAPAAIGPYSQAVRAGGFVFTALCIGIDPATGRLVGGGMAAQTKRALGNLEAILDAAGVTLQQVVKTTVFLTDMADFQTMNEVYAMAFPAEPPARTTVAVAELPLAARVGIEAVARMGGS